MSRDINPFGLRIPPALKAQIESVASREGRSLNTEIVQRLQESMSWAGSADRAKVYASGYISAIADLLKIENPPKAFRNAALVLAKRAEAFAKLDSQEPAVRELASIMAGVSPAQLAVASSELIAAETRRRKKK
jgi:hypothetical protein